MDSRFGAGRRTRTALIGAAVLFGLLVLEWYLVFHIGAIQHLDASAYDGFLGLSMRPHVTRAAHLIANLCDPVPYVFLATIPILIALARRRPLLAVAIGFIIAGANETTELLKPLLAAPRPDGLPLWQVGSGSWPSGHATASMSLALCLVLAAPARWRPFVAVFGAVFALAVCYSFLTLGWHYPSDALGGLLVASIWTLLGVAWFSAVDSRTRRGASRLAQRLAPRTQRPAPRTATTQLNVSRALTPSVLAAFAAFALACVAAALHPDGVANYLRLHAAFVAGAAAIGLVALSIPAAVLLTIRR